MFACEEQSRCACGSHTGRWMMCKLTEWNHFETWYNIIKPCVSDTHHRTLTTTHLKHLSRVSMGFLKRGMEDHEDMETKVGCALPLKKKNPFSVLHISWINKNIIYWSKLIRPESLSSPRTSTTSNIYVCVCVCVCVSVFFHSECETLCQNGKKCVHGGNQSLWCHFTMG